jgi:hypothetical protein
VWVRWMEGREDGHEIRTHWTKSSSEPWLRPPEDEDLRLHQPPTELGPALASLGPCLRRPQAALASTRAGAVCRSSYGRAVGDNDDGARRWHGRWVRGR